MSKHISQPLPTLPQLFKATGIALILAGVILVTTVLPVEYGIDPTGMGKLMGLTAMSTATAEASTVPPSPTASRPLSGNIPVLPVTQGGTTPFRSDTISVTLQPAEGAEIKATMRKDEQFVFNWSTSGGRVNFDMHGEEPGAGDQFTSYWKAMQQSGAQGAFVAPFDGTHGWFWRNRGDTPVTVTIQVSGFYEKLARVK